MLKKIICAGVGGQGVLTLGMILAEAAAQQGKYVTWVPEYGSEMRGGSADCKVKIGDEPIVSPFMEEADLLVTTHQDTLTKFIDMVEEGGMIIAEDKLAGEFHPCGGRKIIRIPAMEIANRYNNPKGMSVVMAGAAVASTGMLSLEAAKEAVIRYFQEKNLPVDMNMDVFLEGYRYVKQGV